MLKWWLPLPQPWKLGSLEPPPRRPIPLARLSDRWVPDFLPEVHQDILWTRQSVACPGAPSRKSAVLKPGARGAPTARRLTTQSSPVLLQR